MRRTDRVPLQQVRRYNVRRVWADWVRIMISGDTCTGTETAAISCEYVAQLDGVILVAFAASGLVVAVLIQK